MSNKNEPTKVLSLAEQEILIKDEILRFVKLAKEKGSLTIEEINDQLPQEIIAPSVLDSFMHGLEVGGVTIIDLAETKKGDEDEKDAFLADPDKEDEDVDEEEKAESEDLKGNDPVRLYLRKMGSVSLLTREGEVEIARITIASTTQDVICVYARQVGKRIHYRVVDEYEDEAQRTNRRRTSSRPLTLEQLVNFFLGGWDLICCLDSNFGHDMESRDEIHSFIVDASSDFYADFEIAVRDRVDDWLAKSGELQ
jgi:hypothetical protein